MKPKIIFLVLLLFIIFFLACGGDEDGFRLDKVVENSLDENLPAGKNDDTDEDINNVEENDIVENDENVNIDNDKGEEVIINDGSIDIEENNDDGNIEETVPISKFRYISAFSGLRLRQNPAIDGEVITSIPFNAKVEILEEDDEEFTVDNKTGKWTRIIWENNTGWVFGGFLSLEAIVIEKAIDTKYITAKSGLRMREEAGLSGGVVTRIPYNQKVDILDYFGEPFVVDDTEGKWTKVRWENNTGWVFGGFLGEFTPKTKSWKNTIEDIGTVYSLIEDEEGNIYCVGSSEDYHIVKIKSNGQIEWDKKYGGMDKDKATSIIQTNDGGFIVAGSSISNDIIPMVGDNYEGNVFYILKLNSNGDMEWDAMYPGANEGGRVSIVQTSDEGYMLAGTIDNENIISSKGMNTGERDFYFLKLNSEGYKLWDAIYGGNDWEEFSGSLIQTGDGGFMACGYTMSGEIKPDKGKNNVYISDTLNSTGDMYIMKIDSEGEKEWEAMYGGTGIDWATSLIQVGEQEYLVAGWTESSDIQPDKGKNTTFDESYNFNTDIYLVKIDGSGRKIWDAMYISFNDEKAYSVNKADSGFIITGEKEHSEISTSSGKSIKHVAIYVLNVNYGGDLLWDNFYGEFSSEERTVNKAFTIMQSKDDGYVVGGFYSSNDFTILKLADDGTLEN